MNSGAVKRFNYTDESRKVLTEAMLLGWADSLLRFAYAFIHDFIADKSPQNHLSLSHSSDSLKQPLPTPRSHSLMHQALLQVLLTMPLTFWKNSFQTAHLSSTFIMQRLCPSRILMSWVMTSESFFALFNTFNLSTHMVKPISPISKVRMKI